MTFELTARCSASELLVHFVVEVVGIEPTRLSDLIYSQASQPNAQHFLIFTKIILFFNIQLIIWIFFVIPVRLELTTPPLKVECSKPTELRDLLFVILVTFHNTCFYLFILFSLSDRGRTCGLSVPNAPLYQTELHLVIFSEEAWGVDPHTCFSTTSFQD